MQTERIYLRTSGFAASVDARSPHLSAYVDADGYLSTICVNDDGTNTKASRILDASGAPIPVTKGPILMMSLGIGSLPGRYTIAARGTTPHTDGGSDNNIDLVTAPAAGEGWTRRQIRAAGVPDDWAPMTDQPVAMAETGIICIVFKRNHKHIVGVVISTDDGETWTQVKNAPVVDPGTKETIQPYGAIPNRWAVPHHGIPIGDALLITDRKPALTTGIDDKFFLAIKVHGGSRFYLGWTSGPQDPSTWTMEQIPDLKSQGNPSLAFHKNKIVLGYIDEAQGNTLYLRAYTPHSGWGAPFPFLDDAGAPVTFSDPKGSDVQLSPGGEALFVSYKKREQDHLRLYKVTGLSF